MIIPVYLDHAASTPMGERALHAMMRSFGSTFANPHAVDHAMGWSADRAVAHARTQVATALCADSDEIVFTSGATEANNLALLGAAAVAPPDRRRVVVAAAEHKSVLGPARALADRGFELVVVPVDRSGFVDLHTLANAVDATTLLISVAVVNNEVGTVQALEGAARLARANGALIHSDAAQALSWMPLDVNVLDVDFLSLSAHKASGPKGIGALYVRRGARDRLGPILFGGGQEDGLRSGTLPTPLCVGFGEACADLPGVEDVREWRAVTKRLLLGLQALAPGLKLNGAAEPRHPGILNIRLPGLDADTLVARLQPHLAVARGSACTSGIPEPSHVLRALGLSADETEESLRFSTGRFTTDDEINRALELFGAALAAGCSCSPPFSSRPASLPEQALA